MSAAAAGAAAAAAARQRREEEEMTGYSERDLAEGWEFKFVRSATGAFRRPEYLRRVLEEEARSGWSLVEKFDNGRIRLKRPASARRMEPAGGIDPYRSHVGIRDAALALIIMGSIFGTLGVVIAIVLTFAHHPGP
jgi:hypothetical protein